MGSQTAHTGGLPQMVVTLLLTLYWSTHTTATPVYQSESKQIQVDSTYELKSAGFPVCCDYTYTTLQVTCIPYYQGGPCYLHIQFDDVDLTAGSSIKIYEQRTLIASISQVGPVHRDYWHRPVVASSTGELALQIYLVASTGTKKHAGFRANITKTSVQGLQNWYHHPVTTNCPEPYRVEHGVLRMGVFSSEDRIHDCVFVIRGVHDCPVYAATLQPIDPVIGYEVRGGISSAGPVLQSMRSGSHLVYSDDSLYIRVRKPVNKGHIQIYYGCHLKPGQYTQHAPNECMSQEFYLYGGFHCGSGQCLPSAVVDNGIPECEDGSDETPFAASPQGHQSTTSQTQSTAMNEVHFTTRSTTLTKMDSEDTYRDKYPIGDTDATTIACGNSPNIMIYLTGGVVVFIFAIVIMGFCLWRRKKRRRSNNALRDPAIADSPPPYGEAVFTVKPEADVMASLPRYEDVYSPEGVYSPDGQPEPPPPYFSKHSPG